MKNIFYTTTDDILRIAICSILTYVVIIIYIRMFGKRSTSKMNNFDWIVTVALGSLLASTVISKDISITEGTTAILLLLAFQYIITKLMLNSPASRKLIKATPQLLVYDGKFIEKNLHEERVLEAEIYAAIRQSGHKSIKQIYAVVLETNANLSVIANDNPDDIGFSLTGVEGLPDGLEKDLKERHDADESDNS